MDFILLAWFSGLFFFAARTATALQVSAMREAVLLYVLRR